MIGYHQEGRECKEFYLRPFSYFWSKKCLFLNPITTVYSVLCHVLEMSDWQKCFRSNTEQYFLFYFSFSGFQNWFIEDYHVVHRNPPQKQNLLKIDILNFCKIFIFTISHFVLSNLFLFSLSIRAILLANSSIISNILFMS